MAQVCTRCGTPSDEPGARFCPSCGGRLEPRPSDASSPAPSPVPPSPRISPALEGARCALHPANPATDLCSRCGNFACPECLKLDLDGKSICSTCADRVQLGHWDVPWEKRAELGFFKAYFDTVKAAAFSPSRAFAGLSPGGKWWDAMSFAMVSSVASVLGTFGLYLVIGAVVGFAALASSNAHPANGGPIAAGVIIGIVLVLAVLVPVSAIVRVYVGTAVDHVALLIAGGGKQGFDATLRAYCYAMAPGAFGLVPFCGAYVWEIWRIVLCIFAYKNVHKMDGGRAAAAVLLPYALCCGLYIVLVVGAQMAAVTAARH